MKIPDDVFETRCRYCRHGRPKNKNGDIPDRYIFDYRYRDEMPCDILGVSQHSKVSGECLSFDPLAYFGICETCKYDNCFYEGFCTKETQPNKRQLFLGHNGYGGAAQPHYWMNHALSTCDRYTVSERWVDRIVKAVTEGRSPANFDPSTMKAIKPAEKNVVAERWLSIQQEASLERERAGKEAAEREAVAKAISEGRDPDQLSLFEGGE